MKKLSALAVLAAVAVLSYLVGYARAERDWESVVLGHALEQAALCANGLNTLAEDRQQTTSRLLDQQLRAAVVSAEEHRGAASRIEFAIPSLLAGLERAKAYADRSGDADLSRRLASLHDELTQTTTKRRV
jgi:hypothetical protein